MKTNGGIPPADSRGRTSGTGERLDLDVVSIESIVTGGDGLARRPDGCVVFVPRTAPGDRVEIEYTETHTQWRRARVTRILDGGADRREPPCRYYALCGGCQLQHLRYDAQRTAKAAIVADSLRRLGGVDTPPPDVVASPREFGYRNRVSLVVRRDGGTATAGYHGVEDAMRVVDVDRCPLAEESINTVWALLRQAWGEAAGRMPPGRELRLTLRGNAEGRVGIAVEGARGGGDPAGLVNEVEGLDALWILDDRGNIVSAAGAATLNERSGAYDVPLAGTAFIQVNREAAALLEGHVHAVCGDIAGRRVVDAYCGFGLRSLEFARNGARVVGIDLDRHAVRAAARGAAGAALPARFVTGAVERMLPRELPADLVVLNPPRRGVARPVVRALLGSSPARVVYVSCNPATLARDLKALMPSFTLESCVAFDLFPQTAHVETVAVLSRRP